MAVEPEEGVEPFTCGPSHISSQGDLFHGWGGKLCYNLRAFTHGCGTGKRSRTLYLRTHHSSQGGPFHGGFGKGKLYYNLRTYPWL
jgi:hypothetical protein